MRCLKWGPPSFDRDSFVEKLNGLFQTHMGSANPIFEIKLHSEEKQTSINKTKLWIDRKMENLQTSFLCFPNFPFSWPFFLCILASTGSLNQISIY